jgi:hypothetical protein
VRGCVCVCMCSICICTIKSLHWLFFCLPEFVVYEMVHGHCVFHCSCSLFAAVAFQGRDVLSSMVSSHGKPHGTNPAAHRSADRPGPRQSISMGRSSVGLAEREERQHDVIDKGPRLFLTTSPSRDQCDFQDLPRWKPPITRPVHLVNKGGPHLSCTTTNTNLKIPSLTQYGNLSPPRWTHQPPLHHW